MTVEDAIRRAHLAVTFPVVLILVTPLVFQWRMPELPIAVWIAATPVSIALACAWWCWRIPHWRVWALEQVEDPEALLETAVKERLMWPPDHPLARTEIRSAELRRRERELMERRQIHPARPEPTR